MFRKFSFVCVFFVSKRFSMIPESLFECVCSHANVMHGVRVICCDSCLVHYVVLHALPIERAFTIASAVATVHVFILWHAFPDDV